jgi:hypothetical protein
MKTGSLILQYYNRRFELMIFEPQVNEIKEYIYSIKKKEKELDVKEKVLEAHLEGTNYHGENFGFLLMKMQILVRKHLLI